jgi:hypothetical protein
VIHSVEEEKERVQAEDVNNELGQGEGDVCHKRIIEK